MAKQHYQLAVIGILFILLIGGFILAYIGGVVLPNDHIFYVGISLLGLAMASLLVVCALAIRPWREARREALAARRQSKLATIPDIETGRK